MYGQWQSLYDERRRSIPDIHFIEGLAQDVAPDRFPEGSLVVIDDLMADATKNEQVCTLFTKGSHHRNISVVCLMQNLFYKGKENRTMSLNSHYLVLFKNPRDQQQMSVLGRQMYPNQRNLLVEEYRKATVEPHGYLVVDLKQDTNENRRLITHIFEPHVQSAWWKKENNTALSIPSATGDFVQEPPLLGKSCPSPDASEWTHRGNSLLKAIKKESFAPNRTKEPYVDSTDSSDSLLDMPSCDDCGVVFDTTHDLQRHINKKPRGLSRSASTYAYWYSDTQFITHTIHRCADCKVKISSQCKFRQFRLPPT